MELEAATDFARRHLRSVMITIKRDGRPQSSNILHVVGSDGLIRVSIATDRAKYHNLRRSPWASLHISSSDFWRYAVLECEVALSEVAGAPDDATVDELVEYYRAANGEHDDWDDYRAAMVRDRRVMARLQPIHAYGAI